MPEIKDQNLRKIGYPTPQAVVYKHESHKLHQAFSVAPGEVIYQGAPVQLEDDGTIKNLTPTGLYIGIAMTDSPTPAYPAGNDGNVEVTVMVQGFCCVRALANAALDCGYVEPVAPDASGYIKYQTSATETPFIAIMPADDAGDLIDILVR